MKALLFQEPKLNDPVLVCGWSGIGNIGLISVQTMQEGLVTEELGKIQGWELFYPRKVRIREGLLTGMEFPESRFHFCRGTERDIIFFAGEEQPSRESKAYRLGEAVLDVAEHFGCRRVYTSGAAVTHVHHVSKPRVWAVPNRADLVGELKIKDNIVMMSDAEGGSGDGFISGLNGLLVGMAHDRGMESVCLMGEFPSYIPHSLPYPLASISVVEVLCRLLGLKVPVDSLEKWAEETEAIIERYYQQIPDELREQLEKLKEEGPRRILAEDGKTFVREVEDFLKKRKEYGDESI